MKMSTEKMRELKILVVGDEKIGKTTLLFGYYTGIFTLQLDSTLSGVNLFRKELKNTENLNNLAVNCWDIAGHERFHELFPILTAKIDAIIVVIDRENEDSISKWKSKLFDFFNEKTYRFLIALVRTKEPIDKSETYQLYSSTMKFNFDECFILNSSDTESINKTFETIVLKIIKEKV